MRSADAARRAAKTALLYRASRRRPVSGIRVLAYHLLPEPRRFAAHIKAIRSTAEVIDEDAFLAAVAGSRPWPVGHTEVLLTFDDGYRQIVDEGGYREAKRLGVRPTVFALAAGLAPRLGPPAGLMSDRHGRPYPLCDGQGLGRLVDSGWTVGSHTSSHWDCGSGQQEDLGREIGGSKQVLAEELGVPIRSFAFPWGKRANASMAALAEVAAAGYEASFSTYRGAMTERPAPGAAFLHRDVVDHWWGPQDVLGCLAGGLDSRGGEKARGSA